MNNIEKSSTAYPVTIGSEKIACILTASGFSTRFGSNKLLALLDGKPVFSYVLNAVTSVTFHSITVLTRFREVETLCDNTPATVLLHDLSRKNETISLGVNHVLACQNPPQGIMFIPCDQPLLKSDTICKLINEFSVSKEKIVRPEHKGIPSSPVIFPEKYYRELLHLPTDKGGSFVIKNNPSAVICVPVADCYELTDIDTPEDLRILEEYLRQNPRF